MMKTAAEIINSKIDFEKGIDYFYPSEIEPMMELYADQYKQENEVLKKEIAKAKMIAEGLMQDNQLLRELSQGLIDAAKEVIRISDRKHDAWDRLKTEIQKAEEQLKQQKP